MGALADRVGYKNGLLGAFLLLALGYAGLGLVQTRVSVGLCLTLVMVGGSLIKPLITGTVARTTTEATRARGYSLFYWVVNVGAFGGKTVVPFVRQDLGLVDVNFFSAAVAALALGVTALWYRPTEPTGTRTSLGEVFGALVRILKAPRLIVLTVIVACFWIIQQQLYATMPKYVIRMVGPEARPEWLANVNPLVVVLGVVGITQLMKRTRAVTSMLVGMCVMPISALCMSLGPWFERLAGGTLVHVGPLDLHPLTAAMILGIAIQGLAECFISPRFLEYFSLQAPKGQEGAYLGFSHLHSFLSAALGFGVSGFLLEAYCPDPSTLPRDLDAAGRAAVYAQAHHIWWYFAALGLAAALALGVYRMVMRGKDGPNPT
jgi:dipeptide/tripeptide permease